MKTNQQNSRSCEYTPTERKIPMDCSRLDDFRNRVTGPIVPMTTPINDDDSVDYDGLAKLTEFYVSNGIKVLIAAGTTGYCYTLSEEEHKKVIETIVQISNHQAFVIAGVSHSGTRLSNRLADLCQDAGADALLLTPPYYRQTARDPFGHYADVARNHDLPTVIYSTADADLNIDFFRRCAEVDNIVGVKEATGNYDLARDLLIELGDRLAICGGGSMRYYMWMWLWGSPGYVTSIANLVPEVELRFFRHLEEGDIASARQIVVDLEQPFLKVMAEYGWHECLHEAMKICDLPAHKLRLPLVEPPRAHVEKMKEVFERIGLLTPCFDENR